MPRKTLLPLMVTMILLTLSAIVSADPVTLTPGQSVTFSGRGSVQGAPAFSDVTFTLSADGSALTIRLSNSNNGNDSWGSTLGLTNFTATSSSGAAVFSTSQSVIGTYTGSGVSGTTGIFSVGPSSPSNPNVYSVGPAGSRLLINTGITGTFNLSSPVRSLTLDNVTFNYVPTGSLVGVAGPVRPAVVPEPATLALLGTGLAAMVGIRRRKKS